MMKNNILERYTQLRFKLDRLNERERVITLVTTIASLIFVWYLISYLPQTNAINNTNTTIATEISETTKLSEKRTSIEALVKDNSVSKLIAKYKQLQTDMGELEKNIHQYHTRFIDDAQLNNLLFSILQQTPGVSITEFSNTSILPTEPAKDNAQPTPPTNAAPQAPPPTATPNLADEHNVERIEYKLVLRGSYFAIKDYLSLLEQSGWQLYWDKLNYKVKHYPEANATVEFYTLKPIETTPEALNEALK